MSNYYDMFSIRTAFAMLRRRLPVLEVEQTEAIDEAMQEVINILDNRKIKGVNKDE